MLNTWQPGSERAADTQSHRNAQNSGIKHLKAGYNILVDILELLQEVKGGTKKSKGKLG